MQDKNIKLFIYLLMTLLTGSIFAQSDSIANLVKYTTEFKFKEGFYLNFEQVRTNKPIPKSRILSSVDFKSNTFFDQITETQTITYFDDFGNSQDVETSKLWGYCKSGILYINIQGAFNRITIIGNICHFVANITSYTNRYNNYSPYGYSPYGYGYSPYDYGYSSSGYGPANYRTTELKQFLLDFSSGKILEYDSKNVALLLMNDPELHDEFVNLRSKKQQQLKFMYVRKFNEKHPLFIPK